MTDREDLLKNEEKNTVEPKDMYLINKEITGVPNYSQSFTASPANGRSINIAVKNYSSTRISFIVYVNGSQNKSTTLSANGGQTFQFTISSTTTFRVVLNGQGNFSISIRAKQF